MNLMNLSISDITILNLISWGLFGFITGLIIHLIDPGEVKGGVLGTTVTGILGAIVGGFMANIFFGEGITGFNLQSFAVAVGGALLLVIIQRAVFRGQEHIKTRATRIRN